MVTSSATGYACGYAEDPHGYVSYAVTRRFVTLTRARTRSKNQCSSRERYQPWRNRVTHVTVGISGVTARVTTSFSRNYKEKEEMGKDDEKAAWVRQNLPTCAGIAQDFKNAFGSVSMAFASENGHVLGKRFEGDGVKLSETLLGPMNRKVVK